MPGPAAGDRCRHLIVFCSLKSMNEKYVKDHADLIAQVRGVTRGSISGYEQMMLASLKSKSPEAVSQWMKNQVYIALGVFLSECAHRKIDACPMEGFDPRNLMRSWNCPKKVLSQWCSAPSGIGLLTMMRPSKRRFVLIKGSVIDRS